MRIIIQVRNGIYGRLTYKNYRPKVTKENKVQAKLR
jgi:hypothetical protein